MENEKSDWNEEYPEDWIDKLKYATAVHEAELNEKINIEEELKFMNVYKSDDPNNYRRNGAAAGQVLVSDGKGNLRWVHDKRTCNCTEEGWQEILMSMERL